MVAYVHAYAYIRTYIHTLYIHRIRSYFYLQHEYELYFIFNI